MKAQDNGRSHWQPVWPLFLFSILILGFMVWNVTVVQSRIIHQAEKDYCQEHTENISANIEKVNQETKKIAQQIIGNDELMAAYQRIDKTQINKIMQPTFYQLKQNNGVAELILTNLKGQVIWSSAADNKFAEDLSYQRVVGKSLRQKTVISAPESIGDNNLLVTTQPIFIDGEYAGLCKISISMSWLGSRLQKSGDGQYAIFQLNGIESTLLWSNKKEQPSLSTVDIKKLHDGKPIYGSLDRSTGLLIVPMQDIDGITVSYVQNKFSLREFLEAEMMNYLQLLLVFLFVVLVNYICKRGRFNTIDDLGNSIVRIDKINKVSFSIDTSTPQKIFLRKNKRPFMVL